MKITFTEMLAILEMRDRNKFLEKERIDLKKQILELTAGDAATNEKAKALFAASEEAEAKMRGAVSSHT